MGWPLPGKLDFPIMQPAQNKSVGLNVSSHCPPLATKYCKRFPRKAEGVSDLGAASEEKALARREGGRGQSQ